jgi:hypothetical protein
MFEEKMVAPFQTHPHRQSKAWVLPSRLGVYAGMDCVTGASKRHYCLFVDTKDMGPLGTGGSLSGPRKEVLALVARLDRLFDWRQEPREELVKALIAGGFREPWRSEDVLSTDQFDLWVRCKERETGLESPPRKEDKPRKERVFPGKDVEKTFPLRNGDEVTLPAWEHRGILLHRPPSDPEATKAWNLSHAESGLAFGFFWGTRDALRGLMDRLADLLYCTGTAKEARARIQEAGWPSDFSSPSRTDRASAQDLRSWIREQEAKKKGVQVAGSR